MTNLQDLWLNDTNITNAGVTKLQKAVPNYQIDRYTVTVLPNRRSDVIKRLLTSLLLVGIVGCGSRLQKLELEIRGTARPRGDAARVAIAP